MTITSERLISGYAAFTTSDELAQSGAESPASTPSVISIATGSFASGFSVAWTVDAGC